MRLHQDLSCPTRAFVHRSMHWYAIKASQKSTSSYHSSSNDDDTKQAQSSCSSPDHISNQFDGSSVANGFLSTDPTSSEYDCGTQGIIMEHGDGNLSGSSPSLTQGHDNASDAQGGYQQFHSNPSLLSLPTTLLSGLTVKSGQTSTSVAESEVSSSIATDRPLTSPKIPSTPSPCAVTPFSYQQALLNRLPGQILESGGKLDADLYTPLLVHDCMMMPGSLATLLGKVNPPIPSLPDIPTNPARRPHPST